MSRLSMNEMTTYRWSFEEDVAHYRAAGIPAIGVWRQKLSDYGEEKGTELVADSGLAVSNLLWAGGFTGSDGRSHRESIDDALEAIRVAQALSCSCLVVYSGGRAGHTHNHARRLLRDALKDLLPAAAAAGVSLALEPMHAGCAAEWTFLTGLDDALGLIAEFQSPRLKLVLDTYHLGWERGFRPSRAMSRSSTWATANGLPRASRTAPASAKGRSPCGRSFPPSPPPAIRGTTTWS
jgi:sugar phosphate isomerase/epimerase